MKPPILGWPGSPTESAARVWSVFVTC